MDISASIVTFNSEQEINKVLTSLRDCDIYNFTIYVIDNASKDNTVKIIKNNFHEIKLICLDTNVGFGKGHNTALRQINSDYHIFINPDITVERGMIEKMVAYMENNKDTVILTPKVLNSDGTEQFLPKKNPTLKYLVGGRFENRGRIFYRWRSEYTLREIKNQEPIEIEFCTGCFMFCRTSALMQCGGFDERFFLHFEDADLSRKMKKIGKTVYIPFIHVTHGWKRENNGSGRSFRIALQSMFKYFWKWK